jgi:hypothetical protein
MGYRLKDWKGVEVFIISPRLPNEIEDFFQLPDCILLLG